MKKIWRYLVDLGDSLARSRMAANLARQGRYQEARRIMGR